MNTKSLRILRWAILRLTCKSWGQKILVAKVREYDFDVVTEQIQALINEAQRGKVFPVVKKMKKIVPEFKSKNSVYEQLDID